jgi:acetylornithine deacetylase/succinyl-diaminopimelate desuccinylase-like protein
MNLADYIHAQRDAHLRELCEFLRIPSISAKTEHKPDIERAANWVADNLRSAGFQTVEIVPTALHPLVYAESLQAPGKPTVLFYGHYDVQKVHGKLPINVKVLIEGEEEVGSVSLWNYVQKNKEKLQADALVVSDTSMLGKGAPSITYGLRGLNYYQIELTGPERDLHSGVYGGAVPNPITILCELFAKLHDKDFRVAIPGFYSDVAKLSAAERKALNALPWKEKDFRKAVGAPGYCGEKGFTIVERLWARPTLELNGIWGGYQGEGAKTVIASKAFAKFSTRLVPNQKPEKIARLVEKHLRKLLPKSVKMKFETLSTGKPWVAPFHAPIFQIAQGALQKGFGKKAVFIREGGSIPFVTQMHDTFKVPCVLLGFGLPDENAHAPDEHIALENYFSGIKAIAHFYEDLASL